MKKIIILIIIIAIAVFGLIKFSEERNDELSFAVDEVVPGEIKKVDADTNTFIHKGYGFSLNFPSNMTASNFREGEGEQVLFQGDNGDWFQIYITPWDEGKTITPERIKQDLPDIVIKDPQTVIIGPRQKEGIGPNAIIFFSKDSNLGETREIWFVYPDLSRASSREQGRGVASFLYQITTYKRLDVMLGVVLSTLTFN